MEATDPIVADAYRRLRSGTIGVDELEERARIVANAQGHGSAIWVLIRVLGPRG